MKDFSNMIGMYTIGLIGLGRAGSRFFRTIMYRQRKVGDISLTAVCDTNIENLKICEEHGIKTFSNATEMLKTGKYDIIVVATNENSHYQILCDIKKYAASVKRIIVEKLLVQHYEQALSLKKIFADDDISVHFVERHSPLVGKLLAWIKDNNLKPYRATFFWGKYRLHDPRPTIGVTSEISHPIDLILMLTNTSESTPFEILRGCYLFSDYTFSGKEMLDTISVTLKFENGLIVNGSSSFLWSDRDRRIILYLSDGSKITHIATLIFDMPFWDIDTCVINEVCNLTGKRTVLHTWKITHEDIDSDILCVSKIYKFLEENITELASGEKSFSLVKLNQACYVQKIIDALGKDANDNIINTGIFNAMPPSLSKQKIEREETLYRFLNNLEENKIIQWDEDI